MVKRVSYDLRKKKSRSHKTKKRLLAKAAMLKAKGHKWVTWNK